MSKQPFSIVLYFLLSVPMLAYGDNKLPSFKDCLDCPEMVRLPGGKFWMGSISGDPKVEDNEKPRHEVKVRHFAIGKFEVTQAQWLEITGDNPSKNFGCANCPVEQVSFHDVQTFIKKINAKTGKHYRLPTEAEWEYACRADIDLNTFCGGDNGQAVAWNMDNSDFTTHSVGQKQANGFGLYDMSGNVWEWTQDCWHENYLGAPVDGSAWLISEHANCNRVSRGGSWFNLDLDVRSASRYVYEPSYRFEIQGFRLAHD